jgi:hypothetical protein
MTEITHGTGRDQLSRLDVYISLIATSLPFFNFHDSY